MKLTLNARALAALAFVALVAITPASAGAIDSGRGAPVVQHGLATFEGRTIDLTNGWGEAQACHVGQSEAITCYRSEAAMDEALGIGHWAGGDYPSAANGYASCGSSLKLYWNTSYGGPVLYMTTRQSWSSLSWFDFDNVTSSYKIGGCAAIFNSGPYANGSTYPGDTSAWAQRSTMGWSWDNALSSVYIH